MNLVNSDWLSLNLKNKNLSILDCSWHLPGTNRNGKEEFFKERIPGAIFFDIDYFSDENSEYPHTLINKDTFSKKVSEIGVKNTDHVICYDTLGIFSSARVCWMFKQFGHQEVSILDGGLKNWKLKNLEIENSDYKKKEISNYIAVKEPNNVKYFDDIKKNITNHSFQLVDARPAGRYEGSSPEPRPELQSGSIEGSKNIPFSDLIDPKTGCLKNKKDLKKCLKKKKYLKMKT